MLEHAQNLDAHDHQDLKVIKDEDGEIRKDEDGEIRKDEGSSTDLIKDAGEGSSIVVVNAEGGEEEGCAHAEQVDDSCADVASEGDVSKYNTQMRANQ